MLNSFNFLKQRNSLVLLMYFNRVEIYNWTGKSLELVRECGRDPDEEILAILDDYEDEPVLIITDYLEESFRHDTGVHASGSDRTALLERKLNYSFRNSPYRSATIIGRESDGRKDDKILLSALTKPEMLEPWIRVLVEKKMRIQAVTSAAYLMQAYSNKARLNDKYTMIVSIDDSSELRQTFLTNGNIQFSRLTSLTTRESSALPDAINHESLQIRQYLERIKLLPFDSQMVIQVFSPIDIDEAALEAHSNELNVFRNLNIQALATSFALTIDGLEKTPTTLFLARILQRSKLANIYAPTKARKYFELHALANGLASTALALVGFVALAKAPALVETFDNWDQVESLQGLTAPLNRQYEQLTQSFPDTPIPSAEMALVVETAEHIDQNSYPIEDALGMISQALVVAPELQITGITWELAVGEAEQEEGQLQMFGMPNAPQGGGAQAIQNATLDDMIQINVTIDGLANSPQSYTEAHNQVLYFLTALEEMPGVTVTSSMMPTDVRVDTRVSTLVDNNALSAPFSLALEVEPM